MKERPLTPAMKMALKQASQGMISYPAVNSSTIAALRARGLITRGGAITQEGMDRVELADFGTIHPCGICGKGVECLHSIPMGDELCDSCKRKHRQVYKINDQRSTGQAMRDYTGSYYD